MAINFGPANGYNVFAFGNMSMSNTDAEGRVAVGGNAVLSNYGVGAGISPLPPAGTDPSFVIGGDVNVSAGSNASGNTIISPTSTVISYTMGNPNGSLLTGSPVDFAEAERYLKCASTFWAGLEPTGTGQVVFGQLNLTGSDPALNIFRNSSAATRENAREILWNFPQALTWSNSTTAIYGSVLAPFAAANTTFSQINGNIIFDSFTGNAESHDELFIGELPEPTVFLLTTTSTTSSTSSSTTSTSTTFASLDRGLNVGASKRKLGSRVKLNACSG